MSEAEERFDSFLARIKDVSQGPPDEYYEEQAREYESYWHSLSDLVRSQEEIFERQRINLGNAELALKIMESGIFHKGGLKGTQLDFKGNFEVHRINLLENFVIEVASSLGAFSHAKDIQGRDNWIRKKFNFLEKEINLLLATVRLYKGGRAAQKLERKRKEMMSLEEDILQRPSKTPKLPDIKRDIAGIFHDFVEAPKVIIAERVSDLLNFFGIDAKMESIRKKLKNK
jgi:hypothetical protein